MRPIFSTLRRFLAKRSTRQPGSATSPSSVAQACAVHLRENKLYLSPEFYAKNLPPVMGEPVIVCAATVEALSENLPIALANSGYRDEAIVRAAIKGRPRPEWKAAKVRSEKQFERGASHCAVIRYEDHYHVIYAFPEKRPGRGFIGKLTVPPTDFPLDLALVSTVALKHLTDPAARYSES